MQAPAQVPQVALRAGHGRELVGQVDVTERHLVPSLPELAVFHPA